MNNLNKEEIHNIFEKIKLGNKEGIEEFYKKYQKLIIDISFTIVKDKIIAEEISQIVFTKIMQMPIEKLPIENELSWLYAVTKNQTIDYLRKQNDNIDVDSIYDIPEGKNKIDDIIDKHYYNKLISRLEDDEKEIVSLKVLNKYTFKEIGQMLGKPTATVQWKYYKAVHTLKLLLSNLTMFVIVSLLYLNIKTNNSENMTQEETTQDFTNSHTDTFTNISKGDTYYEGISTSNLKAKNSVDFVFVILSCVFLVATIFFGFIFVKNKKKRKKR